MEFLFGRAMPRSNSDLVEYLKRAGILKTERLAHALRQVDRGLFVPQDGAQSYFDAPAPIGFNATISAPHMHAECLELLERRLRPGMKALDVGSGSGYLAAVMALLVGETGRVIGVEHIPELVERSQQDVGRSGASPLLTSGRLSLHAADGREGWPAEAPYDAIHVGAAAEDVPQALIDQLKPGGLMVIPVGTLFQDLRVIEKSAGGELHQRDAYEVRYVPLTSKDQQLKGA